MTKSTFSHILMAVVLAMLFQNLNAQVLEAEKSHALSKDAKKGYLGSFQYDETAKQYTLVFVREKNKETIYETMKFDYDFNQLDVSSEVLSLKEAGKKYDFVEYEEDEWKNFNVVRVDAAAFGAGNITLQKGYITREWVRPNTFDLFNYTISYAGYWKYNFNEVEKVKPQMDVEVQMDPRAPDFVKKMAANAAKKIFLTAYMTDEPGFEVQSGRRYYNPKHATGGYYRSAKTFSGASGDIMVVGRQYYAVDKTYYNRFVALKYSAADLTEKARTLIDFEYGTDVFYKHELHDKSLVLFLAPLPAANVKPAKPNPNPRAFTYLRIDKNAIVKERIEFESPSSMWAINTVQLTEQGDLFVYGEALQKNNDKYYQQQTATSKFDNFQIMKISGGKMVFINSTSLPEFETKLQTPSNLKKINPYSGKRFDVGELTVLSSGDLIVSGQENDGGKYGNISLFHFSSDGKLKAQYGYKLEETGKEAQSMQTNHFEFENTDGKTLTWLIYEMTGATDEKLLLYPRMATIDISNAKISDFKQYGYDKDKEFFVDNSRPVILIENNGKVVFFGANKKNKEIWFCRVKLGN